MPPRKKPQTIQDALVAPVQEDHARASRMLRDMDRGIQSKPVLKRVLPRLSGGRRKK